MRNPTEARCQVVYSKNRFGSVNRSDLLSYDEAIKLSDTLRSKGWTSVRVDFKTPKEDSK